MGRLCSTLLVVSCALAGCTSHVRLKDHNVVGVVLWVAHRGAICPGSRVRLVARVDADESRFFTLGVAGGKVPWTEFRVDPPVDDEGVLQIPRDPRTTEAAGEVTATVTPVSHPQHARVTRLPIQYSCAFLADLSGRTGFTGASGMDGSDGLDGSSGSMCGGGDEEAGGDGDDGSDGSDGSGGGPGHDGDDVVVSVGLSSRRGTPVLQVLVRSLTRFRERRFLVDAQRGSLTVRADGGRGGRGGDGGDGGDGGSGGSGCPDGSGGSSGDDGHAGRGGPGGNGGRIEVFVDPAAKRYLGRLAFSNRGGAGGAGGSGGWPASGGRRGRDGPPVRIRVSPRGSQGW